MRISEGHLCAGNCQGPLGRRLSASVALGHNYERLVAEHLSQEDHQWQKGLSPEEAEKLRRMYQERYNQ